MSSDYDLVDRFAHAVADYEAACRNVGQDARNEAFARVTSLARAIIESCGFGE